MPPIRRIAAQGAGSTLQLAGVLVSLAFLLGGGARPDIASLPILRAMSALAIACALIGFTQTNLRPFRMLLWIAGACVALPVAHSIPLAPGIANALPGHQLIAEIDQEFGMKGVWRPMTMSPQWTLNALLALTVPLSMLLLAIRLSPERHVRLALLVCALGCLSAFIAMLQLQGPAKGLLYFYQITNHGSAVGLFANRNHQAVFLACLLPLCFALLSKYQVSQGLQALRPRTSRSKLLGQLSARGWKTALILAGGALFLLPMVFITGSRAGLLAFAIALSSLPFVFDFGGVTKKAAWLSRGLSLVLVPLFAGLAIWLDRSEAVDRLLASNPSDEMRIKILPVMQDMIVAHWPWGSGIGSFQKVYQVHEPVALLGPTYMNHAHNDWLEVIMTGGLPAMLLLFAACAGWVLSAYRIIGAGACDAFQPFRRAALVIVFIFAVASLTDYPLRTPSLAVLFTLCAVWLCIPFDAEAGRPAQSNPSKFREEKGVGSDG